MCHFSDKSFKHSTEEINAKLQAKLVLQRQTAGLPVQEIVIKNEHTKVSKSFWCWVDMIVVCRKAFFVDKDKCYTNYQYVIHNIDTKNKEVALIDIGALTDNIILVPWTELVEHFQYNFAGTAHSFQGLSFPSEDIITIFHANHMYVSRKWLYVAITRSTNLDNLQFVLLTDEEVQQSTSLKYLQYWKDKIEGYKNQDAMARRPIEETEYLKTDWFQDILSKGTHCPRCQLVLFANIDQRTKRVVCNFVANRINNLEAHHTKNCQAMCFDCNRALGNRENRCRKIR